MAKKVESAPDPTPSPEVPGTGADDQWDSPSAHEPKIEPAADGPSEPDNSTTEPVTPEASDAAGSSAKWESERETLLARIATLEARPVEAPKRTPLTLELSEELDPTLSKQLQGLVKQLNERDTEREAEHKAALQKLGALESDNALSKQARANLKMLDALPNDHYRAVFEGEEANDNSEAVAKKMDILRAGYKAAGGKMPTERVLFTEATVGLFHIKAEELRAKGGRPKKDRTINRVTPATNGKPTSGRAAALMAWNESVRMKGLNLPLVTEQDFNGDDKGY